jgi:anti-sigma factor RsiW
MRPEGPACEQVKVLLGVYVLGGLRGYQKTRVKTHLARCSRCRAEYEELAELPALLDMITGKEAAEAGRLAGPAGVPDGASQGPDAQPGAAGDQAAAQPGGAAAERPAAAQASAAGDCTDRTERSSLVPFPRASTLAEPG